MRKKRKIRNSEKIAKNLGKRENAKNGKQRNWKPQNSEKLAKMENWKTINSEKTRKTEKNAKTQKARKMQNCENRFTLILMYFFFQVISSPLS